MKFSDHVIWPILEFQSQHPLFRVWFVQLFKRVVDSSETEVHSWGLMELTCWLRTRLLYLRSPLVNPD